MGGSIFRRLALLLLDDSTDSTVLQPGRVQMGGDTPSFNLER
jgi:hypothetical protein